jgi:hypothetical protein
MPTQPLLSKYRHFSMCTTDAWTRLTPGATSTSSALTLRAQTGGGPARACLLSGSWGWGCGGPPRACATPPRRAQARRCSRAGGRAALAQRQAAAALACPLTWHPLHTPIHPQKHTPARPHQPVEAQAGDGRVELCRKLGRGEEAPAAGQKGARGERWQSAAAACSPGRQRQRRPAATGHHGAAQAPGWVGGWGQPLSGSPAGALPRSGLTCWQAPAPPARAAKRAGCSHS